MKKNNIKLAISKCLENWPFSAILVVFFLLCFGYNYSTDIGYFPDEKPHLGFILNVIDSGFPDYLHGAIYNSSGLNYLEHPALYYLTAGVFGKLLLLIHPFSFKFFRFFNVFFSMVTLYFFYRTMIEVNVKKTSMFFALIPVLSIPIFIMLSTSINNDPLMILGCTIFFYSFVKYYKNPSEISCFIRFLLVGCVITALTKATGSLAIVCVLICFSFFNFKNIKSILFFLNKVDWLFIIVALSIVTLYYGLMLHFYGKFFPSPQENPSVWYQRAHPDAVRMGIVEHLKAFFFSNVWTLVKPYGHKEFIDTIYRKNLDIITILLLPVCLCIAIHVQRKAERRYLQLIWVFGCAYVLFMVLYFLKIHRMHITTGYPGAMQSRYFYGFLPFFIFIYSLAFNAFKNIYIKIIVYTILLFTLLFSFYPSWVPVFIRFYGQESLDTNYGELTSERVFEQTFIAKSRSFKKIGVRIGTYQRENVGNLRLTVLSADGKLLVSDIVDMRKITDNGWVFFDFNHTLLKFNYTPLKYDSTYILRLTSDNSRNGNAITWWALGAKKISEGTSGPEDQSDQEGQARVDGRKVGGAFTFKVYY